MVRFPGVRIAPAISTWACSKTRSEKSGAKGAKTRIIVVGRVRIWFTSFDGSVTSVPYPFFLKMAKVELRSEEEVAWALAISLVNVVYRNRVILYDAHYR